MPVVYNFQCDLCDAGNVGYRRGHLHNRVKGYKQQSSAIAKHYKNVDATISQDLLKRFEVLMKCRNKFDCLEYKMLFIRTLKPNLNVQSDSIPAKVFSKSSHPVRLIFAPLRFKCCNFTSDFIVFTVLCNKKNNTFLNSP